MNEQEVVVQKLESVQQHSKMNNISLMGREKLENINKRMLNLFKNKFKINSDIQTAYRV